MPSHCFASGRKDRFGSIIFILSSVTSCHLSDINFIVISSGKPTLLPRLLPLPTLYFRISSRSHIIQFTHFTVIIHFGDSFVKLCYGGVHVSHLLLYPIEPTRVLGAYAFNKYLLLHRGEGLAFEKISRIPLEGKLATLKSHKDRQG